MCFKRGFLSLLNIMGKQQNIMRSKRLKFIRALMYFDALLLLLSFMMLDLGHFSWEQCSGRCLRILVLLGVFIMLLIIEKKLSRYLRKHRNE